MDSFTDQQGKDFLGKEWLVKIDNAFSRPYLFKFSRTSDGRCSILITDTATVWFETLEPKPLARRWKLLNGGPETLADQDQENAWRSGASIKLASIHTLKLAQECIFSIEDSRDADLAVELQSHGCKWRWECYVLGPKTSAKILSKHLVLPLLSLTHLAFATPDSVSELTSEDLQQAVDKVAKTGRRAQDIHVRQTMSRPRVATALARMTAMFNFADSIPPIVSDLDEAGEGEDVNMGAADAHLSDVSMPTSNTGFSQKQVRHHKSKTTPHHGLLEKSKSLHASPQSLLPTGPLISSGPLSLTHQLIPDPDMTADPSPLLGRDSDSAPRQEGKDNTGRDNKKASAPLNEPSSATEPESGDEDPAASLRQLRAGRSQGSESGRTEIPGPSSRGSGTQFKATTRGDASSDSSPPPRPAKKPKKHVVPEESDSSANEARNKGAPRSVGGPVRGVGVRQPLKRGGRRF